MGSFYYYCSLCFNFCFLLCFFVHGSSCNLDIQIGNQFTISIPTVYEIGFQERRILFDAGGLVPSFKVALSVRATEGNFICFIEVLLGGLRVWSTTHLSKFVPRAKTCVLALTRDGELQLKDSSGLVGWRSRTLGRGVERLQLLPTGNLILTDAQNHTKWQSFDYPADIMLWSQKLNSAGKLTTFLENSTSFYSFEVEQEKIALYLNSGNHKYSYWELRSERDVSNISFAQLGSTGLKVYSNSSRKLLHIRSMGTEPIRFLALERSGTIALYYYSAYYGEFKVSYRTFNELCDLPLPCGPYGICTYEGSCKCLQFAGRQYSTSPNCDEGLADVFCWEDRMPKKMVQLDGVTSVVRPTATSSDVTKEECVNNCLENCTCLAALYSDEYDGLMQECFHYGLVGGVRQANWGVGLSFWVKAPLETSAGEGRSSRLKSRILIIGGIFDGVGICLILGGLFYYFQVIRKKSKNLESENT